MLLQRISISSKEEITREREKNKIGKKNAIEKTGF